MDGPRDYTKWSKSDKGKENIMLSLTRGIFKNIYTNELIYKTETDSQTENKFMITKGENGGGIN